ncbi:MAG TPA: hypothetical protein PKD93_11910, partial [Ferruginibacter sp.]|nr:hypothetical protein [Ferruginibacter sp.]
MLAFVFIKANITSAASGFVTAGILNFLMAVSVDCMIYATTTTISKTAMATDVAASTVMFAITGAITALVMNMGKKAA